MNYSDWFYRQHRYLTGKAKGVAEYNDTKWVDINERYQSLINTVSSLLDEQPYGIVGNNKGFAYLADLMNRSNYTFQDVNQALIDTYKVSLTNAMSRMLVNTQAVMFHCKSSDARYVSVDKLSGCYIVDAPFNQLHFGERDEFIRQRIQKIHNTANQYYIPINEFIQSDITKILGFTILCSVNGKIFNDCQVAVDDKGFKFKIRWNYATDPDIILYKFDECSIDQYTIPVGKLDKRFLSYEDLGIAYDRDKIGSGCILNIYGQNESSTVPNFGYYSVRGLEFQNLQKYTTDVLTNRGMKTATVIVYNVKYLNEVPNVYPACNYYDLMDSRLVYTESGEFVKDVDHNRIVSSNSDELNTLETCTPPIVLDRSVDMSFQTICDCLDIRKTMLSYTDIMREVGITLQKLTPSDSVTFRFDVSDKLKRIYPGMRSCYNAYVSGAILTSMIPDKLVRQFKTFLDNINGMIHADIDSFMSWIINEYYGDNYVSFVNKISEPFTNTPLSNFEDLKDLSENYFTDDDHTRYKRPVSEQCFIALRYHREENAWLFDYPTIKHFKGIQNAFYIDSDLDGTELFKFFVLYTDTESPQETNTQDLHMEQVLDYDQFCDEVDKHIGYIRYWYAENKLLKLSELLYREYTDETITQILSKILKHKLDGTDILDVYPSEMNYEPSNVTSDNVGGSEDDERNPFAINFLFYTLSLLNQDQLQTYFMERLTDTKFHPRYVDVNAADLFSEQTKFPINYSRYCIAPNTIDISKSVLSDNYPMLLYGLPMVMHTYEGPEKPYRYVFNVYDTESEYYMITDNDVSDHYYGKISDDVIPEYDYRNDAYVVKYMTEYLCHVYDSIQELVTNYQKSFNISFRLLSMMETIQKDIQTITEFHHTHGKYMHDQTESIVNSIIQENAYIAELQTCLDLILKINSIKYQSKNMTLVEFFNLLTSTLRNVYVQVGFDNHVLRRARKLYMHLKKINTRMNLYQFRTWLNDLDIDLLNILDSSVASNTEVPVSPNTFTRFGAACSSYIVQTMPSITELKNHIKDLDGVFKETHIDPIIKFCDEIIHQFVFDLYAIDKIQFDHSTTFKKVYSTDPFPKPKYVLIQLPIDEHFYPPTETKPSGTIDLIFQPIVEQDGDDDVYTIRSLANICEYACFNGEAISCELKVYNENGSNIGTISDATISFYRVSSTADLLPTFNQLVNAETTKLEFENDFENFDGVSASSRTHMNYELLIGNHFKPLSYQHEYVLKDIDTQKTPIDRVYLENQDINTMIGKYQFGNTHCEMYFKPVQVLHPDPDMFNVVTSIGSKYFVGQTVYLSTEDGYMFPVKLTTIDHSEKRGFVEAEVDGVHAKWFTTQDPETITKYLTTDIECTIVDDNIRNFMDEFNNSDYAYFNNIDSMYTSDEEYNDCYSLPGDPIYVSNHADFVYTRLQWFFPSVVDNRFIDDEHKTHHFRYIHTAQLCQDNDSITIHMFNHNFNTLSNPEMYPILREEPNDHAIWKQEKDVFTTKYRESEERLLGYEKALLRYREQLSHAETKTEYDKILLQVEETQYDIQSETEFRDKMKRLVQQLEPPTTWYNVRSYDDTLVYIENGRAIRDYSFRENISDLVYSDKLEVFLYDWEHKCWLDPSSYQVTKTYEDGLSLDNPYASKTNHVLSSITITQVSNIKSNKLLVYFAYTKSDIFSDITSDVNTCKVRFKPLLSIGETVTEYDPYADIRIRKHFDGEEVYHFDTFNAPEDFSNSSALMVTRVDHHSKYVYAPVYRMKDLSVQDESTVYDATNFELYVKNPFRDAKHTLTFQTQTYESSIRQPITNFVPDTFVKLICVEQYAYDGSISKIMLQGRLYYDEEGSQCVEILSSSLRNIMTGDYVCSVYRDDMYASYGGLIKVRVTTTEEPISDDAFGWIHITQDVQNRELPDTFIIVPKDIELSGTMTVTLKSEYDKTSQENITQTSHDTYYYDEKHDVRLPFSDVTHEDPDNRLILDLDQNPDIKPIKSTYFHVCRYSAKHVPKNGIIDLTGYIPTPLSRDRYEFWVNGRCIKDPENIIILSPTSIQLLNMTSLRNFEVLELVDDMDDHSDIMRQNTVYIDMDGKTYTSFIEASNANRNITKQEIRFVMNANIHTPLQDYVPKTRDNPNNVDVEEDIMTYIQTPEESISSYNQLTNIPTINGVSIYHPRTSSLGFMEIPNDKLFDMFDQVWKYEHITNPLFEHTQRDGYGLIHDSHTEIHIKYTDEHYIAYVTGMTHKSFTMYISEHENDSIDDVKNTCKIIPFINTGVYVVLDKKYHGKWLHTTDPTCKPIRL